jgi:hypothetical protein
VVLPGQRRIVRMAPDGDLIPDRTFHRPRLQPGRPVGRGVPGLGRRPRRVPFAGWDAHRASGGHSPPRPVLVSMGKRQLEGNLAKLTQLMEAREP